MNVLFSVVIANYNYGRFLADAIQSVLRQCGRPERGDDGVARLPLPTGEYVELIVCDGGSSDGSVEIIKQYADSIAWWCSEKDGGQSAAFNKGFSHATGKYLTWLNADDIFTRNAFLNIRKVAVAHPHCRWVTGSMLYTDARLRVVKCFCAHAFLDFRAEHGFLSAWAPSSFFTKDLLECVGGVDEQLHFLMDIDLWHRFYRKGARYKRTRANIFALRRHEDSKMSGSGVKATEKNLRNKERARREEALVNARYGISRGVAFKMAQLLNYSVVDVMTAFGRTLIWRGRNAYEL